MQEIIKNDGIQKLLNQYLTKEDVAYLEEKISKIKKEKLFKSKLHGLYHSQKVLLFSFLIGKYYKFNDIEMEILLDAAAYHDIGRTEDDNFNMHGFISSNYLEAKPKEYLDSPIYDDEVNLYYLRSICDAHSLEDRSEERIYRNYKDECPKMHKHIFMKLCHALKDADALDRTRMPNISKAALNEKFLRFDLSKKLIQFASYVNSLYIQRDLERNYQNYFGEYGHTSFKEDKCACLHGIGSDFFKLESILDNGILSRYASQKLNIDSCRNFNGSNGALWISVVDADMVKENGDAFKKYIMQGISLYCFVPKLRLTNAETSSVADINNKNEYNDEKYVFDKIGIDQIHSIIIPNEVMSQPVDKCNYLICSNNYDIVEANVKHYRDEMVKRGFMDYDATNVRKYLDLFKQKVQEYNEMPHLQQQLCWNTFAKELDEIKVLLNSEIQIWMGNFYKFFLKKDNIPTVQDVLFNLLPKYNITSKYISDDLNETVFVFNALEDKKINGKNMN